LTELISRFGSRIELIKENSRLADDDLSFIQDLSNRFKTFLENPVEGRIQKRNQHNPSAREAEIESFPGGKLFSAEGQY
jgi:hypothetical protein